MRRASATFIAVGFSQTTCLPASSAATVISAWLTGGVTTATASTSGSATSAR